MMSSICCNIVSTQLVEIQLLVKQNGVVDVSFLLIRVVQVKRLVQREFLICVLFIAYPISSSNLLHDLVRSVLYFVVQLFVYWRN